MSLADRYEILEECGRGTHGVVFRARERASGRLVAIKVLRQPCPKARASWQPVPSLEREGRLLAALRHPGIVEVLEVVSNENGASLVTELVEGSSLRDILAERGRLGPEEATRLIGSAAGALAYAHSCGIIHRDVKPANLLVGPDGSIKLTDFGIAHDLSDPAHDAEDKPRGTPAYLAPELGRGTRADERSDVFALGVVLYESLTGRRPMPATDDQSSGERRREIVDVLERFAARDGWPDGLVDACLDALDPALDRRTPSAAAFARRLRSLEFLECPPDPLASPAGYRAPRPESRAEKTHPLPARRGPSSPWRTTALAAFGTLAVLAALSWSDENLVRPPGALAPAPVVRRAAAEAPSERPPATENETIERSDPEAGPFRSSAPRDTAPPTRVANAPDPRSRLEAPAPAPREPSPGEPSTASKTASRARPEPREASRDVAPTKPRPADPRPVRASSAEPAPRRSAADRRPASPEGAASQQRHGDPVASSAPAPVPEPRPDPPPRPEPSTAPVRAVFELVDPPARGRVELRIDGELVARVVLEDPSQVTQGRNAIASYVVKPGDHDLEVRVIDDEHGVDVARVFRETYRAGGLVVRRFRMKGPVGGWNLVPDPSE